MKHEIVVGCGVLVAAGMLMLQTTPAEAKPIRSVVAVHAPTVRSIGQNLWWAEAMQKAAAGGVGGMVGGAMGAPDGMAAGAAAGAAAAMAEYMMSSMMSSSSDNSSTDGEASTNGTGGASENGENSNNSTSDSGSSSGSPASGSIIQHFGSGVAILPGGDAAQRAGHAAAAARAVKRTAFRVFD